MANNVSRIDGAVDLPGTYISHLENDKKSPTLDVVFRICDALKIPASELIARVEKSRTGKTAIRTFKPKP